MNINKIHNRQSIRLKGYDYSQNGLYFITICCQYRKCLFGKIVNKTMTLNDAGLMVEKWYFELENKYNNIKCREYVVMPNHFHCIVEIKNLETGNPMIAVNPTDAHVGTSLRGRPDNEKYGMHNTKQTASVFDIMDWFKTMTTNEYIRGVKNKNWPRFEKRLWQLRYWDHIIRNQNELNRIVAYIENNAANWNNDKFFN